MILGCTPIVIKPEYIFTAITIIIGASVAYTAYNQYRLSKEKFKLDLFDKRFSVYKGVQVLLSHILQKGKVEMAQIYQFRADTQDAAFLFDDDITKHLGEIDSKTLELWSIQEELNGLPAGDERSAGSRKITQVQGWLIKQLPELKKIFSPYLKFKSWKP